MTPDETVSGERYERVSRIATGGMGEVWRARDTILGREVAVKVLKRELADDPTFRARFAAEARHAAGLHHPNIASVFDYGELDEGHTPFLVMELVDGKPLSQLLVGGRPLDPEQARALVTQAADALGVAHEAGVVHRDVKPANLMVTDAGVVKITDFGIARAADQVAITQTGEIIGTPHYLSPEQASGETATSASDVYALGVLLYECLAGQRPFVADTPVAIALAHIRDAAPPLPGEIPTDLVEVTNRALAKDPADRYADGAAFAAALRETPTPLGPEVTRMLTPTMAAPVAAPVAAGAVAGFASRLPRVPAPAVLAALRDRSRWPLYAAGGLALLLFVALLLSDPFTGKGPAPAPSSDSTTAAAATSVQVSRSAYVGKPVEEVRAALTDAGLQSRVRTQDNPGGESAGTVADLSPTGEVDEGNRVTLLVWSEAPVTQAPATDPAPETTAKAPEKAAKPEKGPKKSKGGGKRRQGKEGVSAR